MRKSKIRKLRSFFVPKIPNSIFVFLILLSIYILITDGDLVYNIIICILGVTTSFLGYIVNNNKGG